MSKTFYDANGLRWSVYNRREAGQPEAHPKAGWYFEPSDTDGLSVYSDAYPTARAAEAAMRDWWATQGMEG